MKISKNHSNRNIHNWLIYDIGDKFLNKYSKYFKGNLVDLGCGEAPYREFFLQYADNYVGVDWTSTLHNSKADIVSDLNSKIEMNDEIADTIVSLSVMEHLCEPQIFLNESYRVLKQGGVMVVQVPWQWLIHEAPYDYFRYTPYGLKYLFEKAGFKDVAIEAQSGFFTMLTMKINYYCMRTIRGPRFIRRPLKGILIPFMFLGQVLAPLLDKLDIHNDLDTTGYYVVAKKYS